MPSNNACFFYEAMGGRRVATRTTRLMGETDAGDRLRLEAAGGEEADPHLAVISLRRDPAAPCRNRRQFPAAGSAACALPAVKAFRQAPAAPSHRYRVAFPGRRAGAKAFAAPQDPSRHASRPCPPQPVPCAQALCAKSQTHRLAPAGDFDSSLQVTRRRQMPRHKSFGRTKSTSLPPPCCHVAPAPDIEIQDRQRAGGEFLFQRLVAGALLAPHRLARQQGGAVPPSPDCGPPPSAPRRPAGAPRTAAMILAGSAPDREPRDIRSRLSSSCSTSSAVWVVRAADEHRIRSGRDSRSCADSGPWRRHPACRDSIRVRSKSSVPPSAGYGLGMAQQEQPLHRDRSRATIRLCKSRIKLMFLTPGRQPRENRPREDKSHGDEQKARKLEEAHPGGARRPGALALPGDLARRCS